jgi:GT2 family glycosyltransferase
VLSVSCVILTTGNRAEELKRACASVREQDIDVELVIIGNGTRSLPDIDGARVHLLPANAGIPGGRNIGVRECTGDVILFLDDDGYYPSRSLASYVAKSFEADASLSVMSFRVQDPAGADGQRRHVPRLRAGDPMRSSDVTTFLGGACAIRRSAFERVGGYPSYYWRDHEETDLAWRLLDAGYRIRYDADAVLAHPALPPGTDVRALQFRGRNRVFLARRNLPRLVALLYVLDWLVLTVVRTHSPRELRASLLGMLKGMTEPCGPRRPMKWRTVLRMARLGRPPVI